jgi:hypothetical protein
MRSESTSAFGQPSETKLTRGEGFSLIFFKVKSAAGRDGRARGSHCGVHWERFVAYSGQRMQMQPIPGEF